MAKSKHFYIRRAHRYLGVLLGIQFLFWTVSGLYFSWSNIDEIHGDLQRRPVGRLRGDLSLVSPQSILQRLSYPVDSIQAVQLLNIRGRAYYGLQVYSGGHLKKVLADAASGTVRPPVGREEAIAIAAESFVGNPKIKSVAYLTDAEGGHEYREKPLPAWAVSFAHPTNTTVYVSADFGRVESLRNDKWRVFDWLWMTHTMDYQGRDNINNWLLRGFSVFGLITVLSGFILYFISSKPIRWRRKALVVAMKKA